MKGLLRSLPLLLFCATSAIPALAAGNLVINGGFQTGTLAPWTSTGTVTVEQYGTDFAAKLGSGAASNDAAITQTIATEAETRYYFSMQAQDVTPDKKYAVAIRVRFTNGGVDFKDISFPLFANSDYFSCVFVAPGSTTLQISTNINSTYIDEISVVTLPKSALVGSYQGTAKLSFTAGIQGFEETIAAKRTDRVVARIYDTGEFVMLRGADQLSSGIFLPGEGDEAGAFVMRVDGSWFKGTATISGKTIKFTTDPLLNVPYLADVGGLPVRRGAQFDVSLTRRGK